MMVETWKLKYYIPKAYFPKKNIMFVNMDVSH